MKNIKLMIHILKRLFIQLFIISFISIFMMSFFEWLLNDESFIEMFKQISILFFDTLIYKFKEIIT